ncbi:MAG: hypothetical protein ACT4OY_05250 [Alphaproteobacteria bacterium]
MSNIIAFNTSAIPTIFKPPNIYDNSTFIELNWSCSDSNEMQAAIDELIAIVKFPGNKRLTTKHLRLLLISIIRTQRYQQDGFVAYPRDNNIDKVHQYQNPFNYKFRKLKSVVDCLTAEGWLEHKLGVRYGDYRRVSRFRPTDKLKHFLNKHTLDGIRFHQEMICGGVIIKDENKKMLLDYPLNPDIERTRLFLKNYNEIIRAADIDLVSIYKKGTNLDRVTTYRIFNGPEAGGRFYGPWWETCKKGLRPYITINGQPTVELDYRANHLYFIYGLAGLAMPEKYRNDPYAIDEGLPRSLVKKVFMMAINCSTVTEGFRATISDMRKKVDKNIELLPNLDAYNQIVLKLMKAHPVLKAHLHTGIGSYLMWWDSKIAQTVLSAITVDHGIPCLSVHDSFLVPQEHQALLEDKMLLAYDEHNIPLAKPTIKPIYSRIRVFDLSGTFLRSVA